MPLLCATNQGRLASLQVLPPSGADTSGTRTATPSSGTDPRGTGAGRARRRCSPFSGHDGGQAAYARNSAEQFGVADEQKPVATPDRRVSMPDERRRVTLTKAQCESPVARDLIVLLTELSADGVVSRDELQQLRAWLEVDRGVDFPALSFLYETIDQISADGEITEDELDLLALAIERVLPKDVREVAATKRKEAQRLRRVAQREAARQTMIAQRAEKRTVRDVAQAREGSSFPRRLRGARSVSIRGASRGVRAPDCRRCRYAREGAGQRARPERRARG